MTPGTKIRINKGETETLIKIRADLGLFRAKNYQIVRKVTSVLSKKLK